MGFSPEFTDTCLLPTLDKLSERPHVSSSAVPTLRKESLAYSLDPFQYRNLKQTAHDPIIMTASGTELTPLGQILTALAKN